MNARIVTTPCHPAFLALRGYTGSISPRGRGARVVEAAAPGRESPDAPLASRPLTPAGPPKPAAPVSAPPIAAVDACPWSLAPAEGSEGAVDRAGVEASLSSPGAPGTEACADAGSAGNALEGSATAGRAGADALIAACSAPGPAPAACADSSVSSMTGGPGSLRSGMRGTRSMAACRPRATRTEKPKTCRGFTGASQLPSPTASGSRLSPGRMEASDSPDRTGTRQSCPRRRCSRGRSGYSSPRE